MDSFWNLYNRGLVVEEDIIGIERISAASNAIRYITLIAFAAYGGEFIHKKG